MSRDQLPDVDLDPLVFINLHGSGISEEDLLFIESLDIEPQVRGASAEGQHPQPLAPLSLLPSPMRAQIERQPSSSSSIDKRRHRYRKFVADMTLEELRRYRRQARVSARKNRALNKKKEQHRQEHCKQLGRDIARQKDIVEELKRTSHELKVRVRDHLAGVGLFAVNGHSRIADEGLSLLYKI